MDYLVDIPVCAYNHEKYISDTIEGIIRQKTNFRFRLLIGEDCSKDGTREIIKDYAAKNPEIIFPFYRKENVGAHENSDLLFKECKAKYIALCDGDDYWVDPFKLQSQVDFLESNNDYSICFHGVYYRLGKKISLQDYYSSKESSFTIIDLAKGNFIHTPSVIFRNGLFEKLPEWFSDVTAGDYVIHMLNARKGKIKYFPQPMAVYRKHDSGIWSVQNKMKVQEKWLKVLTYLLQEDFDEVVLKELALQKHTIVNQYLHNLLANDPERFVTALQSFISEYPALADQWLYKYYPEHLLHLKSSKTFKLAQKLSSLKSRLVGKSRLYDEGN